MGLNLNISLLFVLVAAVACNRVLYDTNTNKCHPGVVCEEFEDFLLISTSSEVYKEFVIEKNKLITTADFYIFKALLFKYQDVGYIVIYCRNPKNQHKVFPYKYKDNKLDKINLSETKDMLDTMKRQSVIKDDLYTRITEYYLPRSTPSLTCPNYTLQNYTGEFLDLRPGFEYVEIESLDLDSEHDLQTYGIVVNKTKDFTLFYVKELFQTNKAFYRVKKGLFSISFDATLYRFVSLKTINTGARQIEVLSINEQGYNTLVFDPKQNYRQTFDIPRTQYLPNNSYVNYLILDLKNHKLNDFSGIIETEYYYSYIIYKAVNNEYTIVVRCNNIDVYLPPDETNRQVHVQLSTNEIYSVTAISNKEGKVVTRSFLKDDNSLYTFKGILSQNATE